MLQAGAFAQSYESLSEPVVMMIETCIDHDSIPQNQLYFLAWQSRIIIGKIERV